MSNYTSKQQPINSNQPSHQHELNRPTIHCAMWQNEQAALPKPNSGSNSSFQELQPAQMNNQNNLGKQAIRRSRNFVPSHRKDEFYWIKRRKNNEAARKSREKRRTNDLILAQKVLLLLQENLQLKKDLLKVRVKYNEVDPEEMSEFHRKMTDGDLVSAVTHNLNLADYGIPDTIIKTFCNGMELDFSAQMRNTVTDQTSPTTPLQVPFYVPDDSEYYSKDQKVRSSSTSAPLVMYENRLDHEREVTTNQCEVWMDNSSVGTNVFGSKHSKSPSSFLRKKKNTVSKFETSSSQLDVQQCPFVHLGSCSSTSTSSSASDESVPCNRSSSIADAQMLQNFVQMSWRKATERYKSSASSSDDAWKDGGSCPGSDYSSFSDSNSTNSSSKGSSEETNEGCSNDDKGHRLPYKLRFKLAGMQNHPQCNP